MEVLLSKGPPSSHTLLSGPLKFTRQVPPPQPRSIVATLKQECTDAVGEPPHFLTPEGELASDKVVALDESAAQEKHEGPGAAAEGAEVAPPAKKRKPKAVEKLQTDGGTIGIADIPVEAMGPAERAKLRVRSGGDKSYGASPTTPSSPPFADQAGKPAKKRPLKDSGQQNRHECEPQWVKKLHSGNGALVAEALHGNFLQPLPLSPESVRKRRGPFPVDNGTRCLRTDGISWQCKGVPQPGTKFCRRHQEWKPSTAPSPRPPLEPPPFPPPPPGSNGGDPSVPSWGCRSKRARAPQVPKPRKPKRGLPAFLEKATLNPNSVKARGSGGNNKQGLVRKACSVDGASTRKRQIKTCSAGEFGSLPAWSLEEKEPLEFPLPGGNNTGEVKPLKVSKVGTSKESEDCKENRGEDSSSRGAVAHSQAGGVPSNAFQTTATSVKNQTSGAPEKASQEPEVARISKLPSEDRGMSQKSNLAKLQQRLIAQVGTFVSEQENVKADEFRLKGEEVAESPGGPPLAEVRGADLTPPVKATLEPPVKVAVKAKGVRRKKTDKIVTAVKKPPVKKRFGPKAEVMVRPNEPASSTCTPDTLSGSQARAAKEMPPLVGEAEEGVLQEVRAKLAFWKELHVATQLRAQLRGGDASSEGSSAAMGQQEHIISSLIHQEAAMQQQLSSSAPTGPSLALQAKLARLFNGDLCPVCWTQPTVSAFSSCGHCFCIACVDSIRKLLVTGGPAYCLCCGQYVREVLRLSKTVDGGREEDVGP